jgi:hypothetical protein
MTNNLVRQIFMKIFLYPHGNAVLERILNHGFYLTVAKFSRSTLLYLFNHFSSYSNRLSGLTLTSKNINKNFWQASTG